MAGIESNSKKILYSAGTNFLSAGITVALVALLPMRLDVTAYGYYQLFMFYNAYTPIAYLGWCEGIYLRYGGRYYFELDKHTFSNQIKLFLLFQSMLGCILLFLTLNIVSGADRLFVFICLSVSVLITNLPYLFQNLLTAVGEIEKYCLGFIVARGTILVTSVLFVMVGISDYRPYVICVLVGDSLASLYYLAKCRSLLLPGLADLHGSLREAKENIMTGLPLLIGNIASMLVLGVMRQGVESGWSVETFGKVSLTLQASNIVLKFISAVGTVLFPLLRRMGRERQASLYRQLATLVQVFALVMMLTYYPISTALNWWLPAYSDGIAYMGVLFPICLFEAKTSLLGYTYLKSLRMEKQIMCVNLVMVGVAVGFASYGVSIIHNLDSIIVGIVILLALRSTVFEIMVSRAIGLKMNLFIIEGLSVSLIFVLSNYMLSAAGSIASYVFTLLIYFILERKNLLNIYQY